MRERKKNQAFRRSKQFFLNNLITFNNLLLNEVTQRLSVLGDTCNKGWHSNSTKLRCTLTDICKAHEEKDFFERRLKKLTKILDIFEKGNKSRLVYQEIG